MSPLTVTTRLVPAVLLFPGVLAGAEKAKFDKLMKDKVMPAMAKMIDADALKAAQEYAKNN